MNNGRRVAESGVFLGVFAILLLISTYFPFLSIIATFFLPTPFILIAERNSRGWSLLFLMAACLLTIIISSIMTLPLTIMFGLIGIVMGWYLQKDGNRLQMYILASLICIFGFIFTYAGSILLFDIDIFNDSLNVVNESLEQSAAVMEAMGQTEQVDALKENMAKTMETLQQLLPSLFILSGLFVTGLLFLFNKPIINRFCKNKLTIGPVRNIQLPKSLLWYYLLTMIISLFVTVDADHFLFTAILNIMFCLQFFMLLQGISFMFFFSHAKKWHKAVPVTIVVLSFILPPVSPIIRILGIIDLGFNLRERIGSA